MSFKQQNYHCVYEYPRDDSETFDLDIGPIWDRSSNYFDLSSFSGLFNYYVYIFILGNIYNIHLNILNIILFISDWGAGSSKTDLLSPSFIDDEVCNPIQTSSRETNFNFSSSKTLI